MREGQRDKGCDLERGGRKSDGKEWGANSEVEVEGGMLRGSGRE